MQHNNSTMHDADSSFLQKSSIFFYCVYHIGHLSSCFICWSVFGVQGCYTSQQLNDPNRGWKERTFFIHLTHNIFNVHLRVYSRGSCWTRSPIRLCMLVLHLRAKPLFITHWMVRVMRFDWQSMYIVFIELEIFSLSWKLKETRFGGWIVSVPTHLLPSGDR